MVSFNASGFEVAAHENSPTEEYEHVSFSLMRALSVKHYRADVPLFVHIMHHHDEFESHPLWEELSRYQNSTCVICVEDIKMEVRRRR